MNTFACLAFLVVMVYASATNYKDCGSKKGKVTSVEVSGCPGSSGTCTLTRGTTTNITINFESEEDASAVKAVVHGVIGGLPLPFPIPQSDGCKSGLSCPLKSGQSYTYKNSFLVRNMYPPISVTVKYELQDQNGADLVCITIPSQLH